MLVFVRGANPHRQNESGLVCIPCSRSEWIGFSLSGSFRLQLLAEGDAEDGKCPASSDTHSVHSILYCKSLTQDGGLKQNELLTRHGLFPHLHSISIHQISISAHYYLLLRSFNKRALSNNGGHGLAPDSPSPVHILVAILRHAADGGRQAFHSIQYDALYALIG